MPVTARPRIRAWTSWAALIGIDRLSWTVDHVAHHREVLGDAVAAVHVARLTCDIERLADVVALDDRDHLGGEPAFVH